MSRPTPERIAATVGAFYEAAYDQTLWVEAVAALCTLFNGSRACIVHFNGSQYDSLASAKDDEFSSLDCLEAHLRDPWGRAMIMLPVGVVRNRAEMIDQPAFRRRELWRDWYMPRDLFNGLSCKLTSSRESSWFIDVQRGMHQEQFDQSDIDLLDGLVPHVLRASQIGQQIDARTSLAQIQGEPAAGMAVVNGHREVIDLNEAAQAVVASPGGPLRIRDGKLMSTYPDIDERFRRLVEDACSSKDGAIPEPGGLIEIDRDPARRSGARLALTVAPFMDVRRFGLAGERRAMVLIRRTEIEPSISLEADARTRFKLSATEARLAGAIATGRTLKQASEEAGITYKSGRTYLERIFAKTGVCQQSQLVALMTRGCALP